MVFDLFKNGKKVGVINVKSTKCINQKYELKQSNITEQPSKQNEMSIVNKKIQALSDRSDFIEDCIAEMAEVVYNTEETT